MQRDRLNICIISDFFFPRVGGVEKHIYMLGQCLLLRGHKVIIFTHTYRTPSGRTRRYGVRYLTNGLKVYYAPIFPYFDDATFPMPWTYVKLLRSVLVREAIDVVHTHQASIPTTSASHPPQSSSFLAHFSLVHARTMGFRTVFTDHSLFGFDDAVCIHLNKLLKFTLSDADATICVSHTGKENIVLRAAVDPNDVFVVPNAVDASLFTPNPSARASNEAGTTTVIIISRLVYRKGVDLVVGVIPKICALYPNVNFVIGGDGPKRLDIEEMVEAHQLHDRVEMLGAVPSDRVRDVMVRGHLFLNCSLTEAFCMAILEAACCGLYVVSTRVGGVAEVLPDHMISYSQPDVDDLVRVLSDVLPVVRGMNTAAYHSDLARAYDWHDVAERTEQVYQRVISLPPVPLLERLHRHVQCGLWAGPIFCAFVVVEWLVLWVFELLSPASLIEKAKDFPTYPYDLSAPSGGRRRRL